MCSSHSVWANTGFLLLALQVVPTLALYDTMQYVRSKTATVCYGMCLGMGGFLLTAGGEKVRGGQAQEGVLPTGCCPLAAARGRGVQVCERAWGFNTWGGGVW